MTAPASPLYTASMAKLFAEQGYLRKAAWIYRHLLAQDPQRAELREALAQVERQIETQPAPTRKETELILREWKDLMKRQRDRERN
ncbi:MAG: hypothetical protein M0036_08770 [Desulfobacteraceae bacterium]|nr:hypothetical protein [Desulfobacteraceae bacterium]